MVLWRGIDGQIANGVAEAVEENGAMIAPHAKLMENALLEATGAIA